MRRITWTMLAFAVCALAQGRPVLMEPDQVIKIGQNLQRAATNGQAIVATTWTPVSPAGAPPEFLIEARLYVRTNGSFVPAELLYSERASYVLGEVAMSASHVALGLPSGLHVFSPPTVATPGVHYVEDPVVGERPAGLHLEFNGETSLLAGSSACNFSVSVLTRATGGAWSTTSYLPGYDRPCDEARNGGLNGEFAVTGDRAVVWNGQPVTGTVPTEARVFERSGTTWNQTATITRPANSELFPWQFGPQLALDLNDILISGATRGTHVFRMNNGAWTVAANLANYDSWRGTWGSASIDADGSWLTQVGYSAARDVDVVHLWRKNSSAQYSQVAMLAAPKRDYIYAASLVGPAVLAQGGDSLYFYDISNALADATPTYQDNFGSHGGGWTPLASTQFSIVQSGSTHVYRQSSIVGDAGAIQAKEWKDQSIAADIKPINWRGSAVDVWVGLVTRYLDESNYYYVTLRGSDRVSLRRRVGGVFTELASAPLAAPLQLNRTYRVQLESSGTMHTAYIDGQRVLSAFDASLSHGHAGLRTYAASADFDNVVIAPGARRTLFQSNFNETFEIDPVVRLTGSWSITNDVGRFELTQSSTASVARATAGESAEDQVVQSNLRIRQIGTGFTYAGLMARYLNAQNYYYVAVRPSGEVSLRKLVNGVDTVLGSITPAAWQQLRLEVIGHQLRVFTDNRLVLERTDLALTRGRSGFVTFKTAASYDDFVAYQP